MNNVESPSSRSSFFPNTKKNNKAKQARALAKLQQRNSPERMEELKTLTKHDAKVKINDVVKDFSRIKKAVDSAPDIDNSAKIAKLKQQINQGNYKVDYEALADKILTSEY